MKLKSFLNTMAIFTMPNLSLAQILLYEVLVHEVKLNYFQSNLTLLHEDKNYLS